MFPKSPLPSTETVLATVPGTVASLIVSNSKPGSTVQRQLSLGPLFGPELFSAAQAITKSVGPDVTS